MPCCKHIIADYGQHIPWFEDLLCTFLSFCPIQNPISNPFLPHTKSNFQHIVSVFPDCPVLQGLTLSTPSDGQGGSRTAPFYSSFAPLSNVKGLGFRRGVMPCCKHIIADYGQHIPWIEDLLCTFLSFCPIVSQNPTLVHSFPDCPVLQGLTLPPPSYGQGGSRTPPFTLDLHPEQG
jgi:hypothetical protein